MEDHDGRRVALARVKTRCSSGHFNSSFQGMPNMIAMETSDLLLQDPQDDDGSPFAIPDFSACYKPPRQSQPREIGSQYTPLKLRGTGSITRQTSLAKYQTASRLPNRHLRCLRIVQRL